VQGPQEEGGDEHAAGDLGGESLAVGGDGESGQPRCACLPGYGDAAKLIANVVDLIDDVVSEQAGRYIIVIGVPGAKVRNEDGLDRLSLLVRREDLEARRRRASLRCLVDLVDRSIESRSVTKLTSLTLAVASSRQARSKEISVLSFAFSERSSRIAAYRSFKERPGECVKATRSGPSRSVPGMEGMRTRAVLRVQKQADSGAGASANVAPSRAR
jgi:hypothetical protein